MFESIAYILLGALWNRLWNTHNYLNNCVASPHIFLLMRAEQYGYRVARCFLLGRDAVALVFFQFKYINIKEERVGATGRSSARWLKHDTSGSKLRVARVISYADTKVGRQSEIFIHMKIKEKG